MARSSFPEDYAVFQVDGDETWYAGWMERDSEGMACEFHVITDVHDNPIPFASRDDAERICGYAAIARMYPTSHWLGDEEQEEQEEH